MSEYWSKLCFLKGVGHFERKFQGDGGSSTNEFWGQKTRASGLSRGVVCVILRSSILIQYRRVTQTHRHTMMAITRASLAPRG